MFRASTSVCIVSDVSNSAWRSRVISVIEKRGCNERGGREGEEGITRECECGCVFIRDATQISFDV